MEKDARVSGLREAAQAVGKVLGTAVAGTGALGAITAAGLTVVLLGPLALVLATNSVVRVVAVLVSPARSQRRAKQAVATAACALACAAVLAASVLVPAPVAAAHFLALLVARAACASTWLFLTSVSIVLVRRGNLTTYPNDRSVCGEALRGLADGLGKPEWLPQKGSLSPAKITYAMVAVVLGLTVGTAVADATRADEGQGGTKQQRDEKDEDEASREKGTGTGAQEQRAPAPVQTTAVTRDATAECGYDPYAVVAEGARDAVASADQGRVVAAAMVDAYRPIGPIEVGCPHRGVARAGDVVYAELTGGEDSPALVMSDLGGRAAVVFGPAARVVLDRVRSRLVAYVRARVSTGTGDYQALVREDRSCELVVREPYGAEVVVVPPAVAPELLALAAERGEVPSAVSVDQAGTVFVFRFDGSPTVVIRADGGDERVRPCVGLDRYDTLAAQRAKVAGRRPKAAPADAAA